MTARPVPDRDATGSVSSCRWPAWLIDGTIVFATMDVAVELETTRPFAAGAFGSRWPTSDPADQELIETLFQDLPRPDPPTRCDAFVMLRSTSTATRMGGDGPRLSDQPMTSRWSAR